MVFSDRTFLFLFLPIALGVLFALRPLRAHIFAIIFLSLIFYYYSSGALVLLLLGVAGLAWAGGLLVNRSQAKPLLAAILIAIFAPLIWFKYAFFFGTVAGIREGSAAYDTLSTVILPIGISFYTFQAVSYVVDVWRGDIKPDPNLFRFAAYLCFFPQLIAGPIVRYADVAENFANPQTDVTTFAKGIVRFTHGLAKKVLIADNAGRIADACFALPGEDLGFASAAIGTLAYTIQIYFDFSGYSDMAIGLGLMAGIRFPENFRSPYQARSITEFWRRWHISLSTWFRDYLYIPLGGNRRGVQRTYINLFLVFVATGLWHGAAWVFVIWGLYHGAFLIGERMIWGKTAGERSEVWLRWVYLLPVVAVSWIIFRATSVGQVGHFLNALVQPFAIGAFTLDTHVAGALTPSATLMFLLGCAAFVLRTKKPIGVLIEDKVGTGAMGYAAYGYSAATFAIVSVAALSAGFSPFLYFRF
ncbi:MAG: MBOAT family O-acyltransferase [Pseudomonadota bacterium]